MTIQEEYARLQQQINDCDHKGDYVGLAGYMERYLQLTGEIYGVESPDVYKRQINTTAHFMIKFLSIVCELDTENPPS